DTRLGHAGGQVASQEGSLIGGEEDVPDVLNGRIVGVVDNRELLIGELLGVVERRIAQQEADGHNQVIILIDKLEDVPGIVGLLLGLKIPAVDAQLPD